jgi:hypothetical protein
LPDLTLPQESSVTASTPSTLRLPVTPESSTAPARLPAGLTRPGSRGADGNATALTTNVIAKRTWTLTHASRSDDAPDQASIPADAGLLALEAADGTTIFMRADALAERMARLATTRPELIGTDGSFDLAAFRPRDANNRGLGDWIWRQVTSLELVPDDITRMAKEKAGELTGKTVEDLAVAGATWLGAKAIVWAIEKQLAGEPGLYPWRGGALEEHERLDGDAAGLQVLSSKPGLIFIHGTGSHTLGSFGELPGSHTWSKLTEQFEGRVFGFEHRTFSESPIDNALALVRVLPRGARLSIVTHSRGGLVGDLLCLDPSAGNDATFAELIENYRRRPGPQESAGDTDNLEKYAAQEQAKLTELIQLLRHKALVIDRYVRVASPARGTALLTDNLDLFLSGLLTLVRRFGAWSAGAAGGLVAGPGASAAARAATDKGLEFLSRVVLEIANRRLQAQLLPGIEAMLPEAPMGMLLARAPSRPGLQMAVIAGDIEGGGFLKRLGVMFTDWMFFDRADNDLVVDTTSMYGGLAWQASARAIFVQGENVNHFRYFRDDTATADGQPLPQALHGWLSAADPLALPEWASPAVPEATASRVPTSRGDALPAPAVLVYLPGIMGSEIAANGDKIWLDPLDLARGRLERIAMGSTANVTPQGLVGMAYGKLADHLARSHELVTFTYDWRQPIAALGAILAGTLRKTLADHPDKPVRILAHSMGGLVVRAAFAADKTLWDAIIARDGGRLLMLGTPNRGSHLFVETLLGQSDTIRTLARIDLRHNMQQILDIVAGFPGAVHLLPAPGFADTGNLSARDYYSRDVWDKLSAVNNDFWFGRRLGGKPTQEVLNDARDFWQSVADTSWVRKAPERIAYIFGQSDNTPCGLLEQTDGGKLIGLALRGTPDGDGSVTWASGHLADLPAERKWLMPVDHMGLTSTEKYFEEIDALLTRGSPRKLTSLPVSRGDGSASVRTYRAGPPEGYPSAPEAIARLLGGRVQRTEARGKSRLVRVSVKAMDLRFVRTPIMCGHYHGDPIAAAESVIDRYLVDGALSQRQRLGIHSGELGNATIVLMPRTPEDRRQHAGRGAVVVGLGEMGKLSADGVTEAVRSGVLRYLLHAADRYGEEPVSDQAHTVDDTLAQTSPPLQLSLASLLIGSNSAAQLDVDESVKAVVLGVLMANRDFDNGTGKQAARRAFVADLQFIEVYRDAAISAAHAVSRLNKTLANDLKRLNLDLETATEVRYGEGTRQRLSVSPFTDYWPRLVVFDADREDSQCSRDCYTPRFQLPIPPENLRQILRIYGYGDKTGDGHMPLPTGLDEAPVPQYAKRLKFVYMGERARAESVVLQRQPGLVEKLADSTFNGPSRTLYSPDAGFGNTLFQLLVPLDFKGAARKAGNLILVVDESTANLPWEMLEADGKPLVLRTRVVRQFMTPRFRQQVVRTDTLSACVIANPSTDGFHAQFGGPGWKPATGPDGRSARDSLADLPGAAGEGDAVSRVLTDAGYAVTIAPPDSAASDVFTRLFARPYRILMVSAHGIFAKQAADGSYRSGVVLSDGLLLSATEIGLMENVPDLVFLSCCHLGKIGAAAGSNSNRLAYSLARELIDMGVRCVVAAGWEVDDAAARTFTETFFDQMANQAACFGTAISMARQSTFDAHPACNTWGAYQAYGDPSFQLKVQRGAPADDTPLGAPEELIDWLEQRRLDSRLGTASSIIKGTDFKTAVQRVKTRLKHVPDTWVGLPEVQQTLGRLYAEYGGEGFPSARQALLRAIGADSSRGLVPISAIEQLANLEARQAERLSEPGPAQDLKTAPRLANDAIARLTSLITLASPKPHGAQDVLCADMPPNLERLAILASAYKRKAIILSRASETWKKVAAQLALSRNTYALGEGSPETITDWNPYGAINRLQLDALLGDAPAAETQFEQCEKAARARFAQSYDFFDAIMPADTAVARWLHDSAASVDAESLAGLTRGYRDALCGLGSTRRQIDSVMSQLGILAELLECRAAKKDRERARLLKELAAALQAREKKG